MKLTKFLANCLAFSAVIFAGCTEEKMEPTTPDDNAPEVILEGEYELNASIGDVTKTVLSNVNLSWEKADVINIWTGEGFTAYTTAEGDGRFTGDKKAVLNGDKYLGLYPTATVTGTKATFTIPQEQTFAVRSANDLPMVAVWGEGEKCNFNPVCSIIEMPLFVDEGVELASIAYDFKDNVGAGEYTYDWAAGTYESSVSGDITLTGEFTANAETPTYVYNAVVPGDYSGGFTLTLTDTDNCAMALTATKGGELAAGKIQPLGDVRYKQLAPEYEISYDDWAATAILKADLTGTGSYRYYLSTEVNGEPLEGLAPVEITNKAAGSKVKLYGYLCSENVATTGVKDGDKLYFVTKYYEGKKEYSRSVEYTYHPDPLEVVVCGDALMQGATKIYRTCCSVDPALTSDDVYAGAKSIKWLIDQDWSGAGFQFDYPYVSFVEQEAADYYIEFWMKPNKDIKSTYQLILKQALPDKTATGTQVNIANFAKNNTIVANEWNKVSVQMRQVWGDTKLNTEAYIPFRSACGDNWLCNFKNTYRLFISTEKFNSETSPTEVFVDHFTIRKSTL